MIEAKTENRLKRIVIRLKQFNAWMEQKTKRYKFPHYYSLVMETLGIAVIVFVVFLEGIAIKNVTVGLNSSPPVKDWVDAVIIMFPVMRACFTIIGVNGLVVYGLLALRGHVGYSERFQERIDELTEPVLDCEGNENEK